MYHVITNNDVIKNFDLVVFESEFFDFRTWVVEETPNQIQKITSILMRH